MAPYNNVLIRSGEAPAVGWSRNMLYSGFYTLPRSVIRRQTGFAARITRTLYGLKMKIFGIIGILLGVAIALSGIAYIDSIGWMGVTGRLGLGFLCSALGLAFLLLSSFALRLRAFESKIDGISKQVSTSNVSTVEQIVDQLRQEGLILPSSDGATDQEIGEFLN